MRYLLLRAQRVLKEGVVIRKRQGEPKVPPPLVRLPRAAALSARDGQAHRARQGRVSVWRAEVVAPYDYSSKPKT